MHWGIITLKNVLCNFMAKNSGIYFYTTGEERSMNLSVYECQPSSPATSEIVQNQRIRGEEPGTQES